MYRQTDKNRWQEKEQEKDRNWPDLRDSDFLAVVDDLLSHHYDKKLLSQLYQAASVATFFITKTKDSGVIPWIAHKPWQQQTSEKHVTANQNDINTLPCKALNLIIIRNDHWWIITPLSKDMQHT